jgi:hypothetical protein
MTDEDMNVKRLCALTEQTTLLKPEEFATREEVRALAREVMRLRVALRGARLHAQRAALEAEQALVNARIAGGKEAL